MDIEPATAPTPAPPGVEDSVQLQHEPWERVLPFVGAFLALVVVLEITITWVTDDLLGPVVLRTVMAEMFPGREAAIPLGLAGHIDEWWLWQITWTVDLALFCFVYPVFLSILHRRRNSRGFFMRKVLKMEAAAQSHKKFAKRWGPWGVFVFMLIPFMVNGPLVGMIVGRIAGIKTRNLLLPVVAANLIGNGVWVILFDEFFWQMRKISAEAERYVAFSVFGLLFTLAVVGILLDEWNERKRRRNEHG